MCIKTSPWNACNRSIHIFQSLICTEKCMECKFSLPTIFMSINVQNSPDFSLVLHKRCSGFIKRNYYSNTYVFENGPEKLKNIAYRIKCSTVSKTLNISEIQYSVLVLKCPTGNDIKAVCMSAFIISQNVPYAQQTCMFK